MYKKLSEYKKGDLVKVKILDINIEKERISLGIKQIENDPISDYILSNPIKSKVTGVISEINEKGLTIKLAENISGFIKKSNLAKERSDQKTDRFAIDEKIDSMIISIDNKSRIVNLSVKEMEIDEEKKALNKYGSSDSGASLGDILGSVLDKKNNDNA